MKTLDAALRLVNRAMRLYRLIENNDRVLVCLSGGKDSLMLLELISRRAQVFFPRFSVGAVHVRMTIEGSSVPTYQTDTGFLSRFCEERGVPFSVVDASFSPDTKARRSPCFLCSWMRRKAIFDYAQREGYNKIALGHHQDDLLHTALMNMMYDGRFATMPARLQLRKMPIAIIRPMCMVPESLAAAHAEAMKYPSQCRRCPYEHDGKRAAVRRIFASMESESPDVRHSMWHALADHLVEDAND